MPAPRASKDRRETSYVMRLPPLFLFDFCVSVVRTHFSAATGCARI
jgi:hypothetical protein